jgi:hypothetical protein
LFSPWADRKSHITVLDPVHVWKTTSKNTDNQDFGPRRIAEAGGPMFTSKTLNDARLVWKEENLIGCD